MKRDTHLTELSRRARDFAVTSHAGQTYGSEFPYILHLQSVYDVLLEIGFSTTEDEDLFIAAWLHDVVEDTPVTLDEVESLFGKNVADIVGALTEPKGGNREWRHSQAYPRIAANKNALYVKLADRVANVRSGGSKSSMYRKEHPKFREYLYDKDQVRADGYLMKLWWELDDLIVKVPLP